MKLSYYGHAACRIETGDVRILIDPYLSQNPLAPAGVAETVSADYIFVTHAHFDHLGDTEAIARRCDAVVCGVPELKALLPNDISFRGANLGGWADYPFGRVKMTSALHTSGIPGGLACGFLLEAEGKKIYHAGDTALIADFSLLASEHIDLALLPIGGHYTMGIEEAVQACSMILPRQVLPIHYNTFPAIHASPEQFRQKVELNSSCQVLVLQPGEEIEV